MWEIKHTIRMHIEWATFWYITQDHSIDAGKEVVKENGPMVTGLLHISLLHIPHGDCHILKQLRQLHQLMESIWSYMHCSKPLGISGKEKFKQQ